MRRSRGSVDRMAQFQLTENEFVRGSMAVTWKPRTLILFGIAYLLLVASLGFRQHNAIESFLYPLLGIVGLVGLVYLVFRYRLRKVFNEIAALHERMNVAIDEKQLSYTWSRGNYILPWASI